VRIVPVLGYFERRDDLHLNLAWLDILDSFLDHAESTLSNVRIRDGDKLETGVGIDELGASAADATREKPASRSRSSTSDPRLQ
jgi:hypothetical protein